MYMAYVCIYKSTTSPNLYYPNSSVKQLHVTKGMKDKAIIMLCTNYGSVQSADCPAQSVYPQFECSIHGLT